MSELNSTKNPKNMEGYANSEMKTRSYIDSTNRLTLSKRLRGIVCLLVLIITAFIMLVYLGFVTAIIIRIFSLHHYSRKLTSIVFGAWLVLWPFLFEKINKTNIFFSGDCVPVEDRVLLFANHRTEVDWMYLWDLALRKGRLGYVKYVLKNSLMWLPIFGWAFHILEFIPVERRWTADKLKMKRILSTFNDRRDPLWLAVFPEGTDFTEQKCIKSQKFAAENGLPVLKNVLLPKTKGFFACFDELKNSLDAVYDITIAYKSRCPSFMDNVLGISPSQVHIHVRRVTINEIPILEENFSLWLMNTFCLKDQLLSGFHSQGHFPGQGTEKSLSTIKCLVNLLCVILFTVVGTYVTCFCSSWFKLYVSLVHLS